MNRIPTVVILAALALFAAKEFRAAQNQGDPDHKKTDSKKKRKKKAPKKKGEGDPDHKAA